MKTVKRILCSVLSALLLMPSNVSFAEDAEAKELHIRNAAEFVRFAEDCSLDAYSEGLNIFLEADIDFDGAVIVQAPYFNGSFNGQGYTLSGFSLKGEGSNTGLFRSVEKDGVITNLQVKGNVCAGDESLQTGGIAAINRGEISKCIFSGIVEGAEHTGGIAGENYGNITECRSEGFVSGRRCTGGIAGYSSGVLKDCSNEASVNTEVSESGIALDSFNLAGALTGLDLVSANSSGTISDTGGICGLSEGVIVSCVNETAVGYPHYGYNVGGIAGRQCGYIHSCDNKAAVNGRKDVGGIVGQMEPFLTLKNSHQMQDTTNALSSSISKVINNSGNYSDDALEVLESIQETSSRVANSITVNEEGIITVADGDWSTVESAKAELIDKVTRLTYIGEDLSDSIKSDLSEVNANATALLGMLSNAMSGNLSLIEYKDVSADNAENENDIEGRVSGCHNSATIEGDINIGGIVGAMEVENEDDMEGSLSGIVKNTLDLQGINSVTYNAECVCSTDINEGEILCRKDSAGGIAGTESIGLISRCENYADVSADGRYVGGIAGTAGTKISGCCSKGSVTAAGYAGGIAGTAANITDCTAIVSLDGVSGCRGSIAGYLEITDREEIKGNVFLANRTGAIDGVSYKGYSEPVTSQELAARNNLPDRMLTNQEKAENEEEQQIFTASIVSEQMTDDGKNPIAIAVGEFPKGASLFISEYVYEPVDEKDNPSMALILSVNKGRVDHFKIYSPNSGKKNETLTVYVMTEEGRREIKQEKHSGSYITVPAKENSSMVLVYLNCDYTLTIIMICAGIIVVSTTLITVIHRKRRARNTK